MSTAAGSRPSRTAQPDGTGLQVLRAAAAGAPRRPGVYFFLGDDGEVLYVGKAGNLPQRLRQHAATKVSGSRLHQRYHLVRRVVWELAADEKAAEWREADLIFALAPPFNAPTGLRDADPLRNADPLGAAPKAPYVVLTEIDDDALCFTLEPEVLATGRAYGCFPHLGKGVGYRLGVACSDGYTALLRLLWAAGGDGTAVPAVITRSAPPSFTVAVGAETRGGLRRFLSGTTGPRFIEDLLRAAADRPAFMQPALQRDAAAAAEFFAAGPRMVRRRRLQHGVRARVLDATAYRNLVRDEIASVISAATD